MQEITSHKVNGLNEALNIYVLDDPGSGGACHEYELTDQPPDASASGEVRQRISFQNGPIHETGVNGVSNEALLAIVEHRLQGFQSGDFACRENALALTKIQEAMHWLHHRTRQRLERGVEGTNEK